MNQPILTIILPTYNEALNVRPLLLAIRKSLDSDLAFEILFVDDSDDDTPEIIKAEMSVDNKIRLIHRPPTDRTGLATAFVAGFENARGVYICCMDSDLQHPPEVISELLKRALRHDRPDIVVATRYIEGGSAEGLGDIRTIYGLYRRSVSLGMKYFTQIIFAPTRRTSDPLGGFFLFKKDILQDSDFNPKGFKILVEMLMRAKYENVCDVPYKFLARENDESKASLKQGVEFFKHLWHIFRTVPDAGRFIKFCFVGFIGTIVNLGTLYVLVEYYASGQNIAWLIAVLLSILGNYVLNSSITYGDRPTTGLSKRTAQLFKYYLVSLGTVAVNFVVYSLALSLDSPYLLAATYGILVSTLLNYVVASSAVWTSPVVIAQEGQEGPIAVEG